MCSQSSNSLYQRSRRDSISSHPNSAGKAGTVGTAATSNGRLVLDSISGILAHNLQVDYRARKKVSAVANWASGSNGGSLSCKRPATRIASEPHFAGITRILQSDPVL